MHVARRTLLATLLIATSATAATISAIIPASAPRGARVILTGTGLDAPDLSVTFSAGSARASAAIVARSASLVELSVPPAASSGEVIVMTASGTLATRQFTVTPHPEFVSVATQLKSAQAHDLLKRFSGLSVTASGVVYAADRAHHRIVAVVPNGTLTVIAGTGSPGYVNGSPTQAEFKDPSAVAVDRTNTMFVSDAGNHVIRKIAADGNVTTLAGSGRPEDVDGTGTNAGFKSPAGLALDALGNLYVADTGNNKIKLVTPAGTVTTIAGGAEGLLDGPARQSLFKQPEGVAVAPSGTIYVADTKNHIIRRISNGSVVTIAGTGFPGYTDGPLLSARFSEPAGIALDDGENIYVADRNSHSIRKVTAADVTTVAGNGKVGYADGNLPGQFKEPGALVALGCLYVADTGNDALRIVYQRLLLTDMYPRSGDPAGGTAVRIFGTGFVPGATQVRFGLATAEVTWMSATEVIATAPPGSEGLVDLVVTVRDQTATAAEKFRYERPYVAIKISPSAATLDRGASIQLRAFGLAGDGSSNEVTADVAWTTSTANVVSVSTTGFATALTYGSAQITASRSGISGTSTINVAPRENLPPDPAAVAPPLDPTVAFSFGRSVAFLSSGTNPIQRDVIPGAIEEHRVAVVRGRVVDRLGQPIPGARVSILGAAPVGYTLTRADGWFDLAFNGGEP